MLERSDRQLIGSSYSNKNPLGDQLSEGKLYNCQINFLDVFTYPGKCGIVKMSNTDDALYCGN